MGSRRTNSFVSWATLPADLMALIRFENIGKTFGSRTVFSGITDSVEAGEYVAVVGPNGSGKSTLLRIAAGLLRPTQGVVTLYRNQSTVSDDYRSRVIGYLAPYVQFYRALSARENLSFLVSLRADADRGRVDEVLGRVDLLHRGDDLVGSFSSGMLQRLRLGAAIVHRPQVLLLDEPFANLDEPGAALVSSVIDETRSEGGAVLVATNRIDVSSACSRKLSVSAHGPLSIV